MPLVSVIKYDGDPDVFAWKYPDDELGTWSQLIVNESQQAILFKGGQALDVFEAGRHKLDTKNIPLLERLVNIPFGGNSPFKVEVWFVNKAFNLDVKWGTPSPVQIQDPKYGIFVPVRVNGIFGIRITDPKRFLIKLVGTLGAFTKDEISRYFRGIYVTKVKDAVSTFILEKRIDVLKINMYLDEISDHMKECISPVMDEYGIDLVNFFVNEISIPDDDPAVVTLRDSLAKKAKMDIIGYDYVQERSFDTLEGAAMNPGSDSSSLMGAGIGLGMGLGMGTGMGGAFGQLAQQIDISGKNSRQRCPNCGSPIEGGRRFCSECGTSLSMPSRTKDTKFCSECGSSIARSSRFCPECGQSCNATLGSE